MKMKCVVAIAGGVICFGGFVLRCGFGATVLAAPAEPPVFTSSNHLLDLLVIAEPATITLGDRHPVAMVFEMCRRVMRGMKPALRIRAHSLLTAASACNFTRATICACD